MRMCFTNQACTWEQLAEQYQVNPLEFKLLNPQLSHLAIVPARSKIRLPLRSYQHVQQHQNDQPTLINQNMANQPETNQAQELFEIDDFDEEQVRQFYDALFRESRQYAKLRADDFRERKRFGADYQFQIPMPNFEQDDKSSIHTDLFEAPEKDIKPIPKQSQKKRPVLYPNIPGVWVNQQPSST